MTKPTNPSHCTATSATEFRCPLRENHPGDHMFPRPDDWQGWVVVYRFKRKKKLTWVQHLLIQQEPSEFVDRGDEFLFCFGPFMSPELAENYNYDATFGPQYKKKKYTLFIGDPYAMGLI